MLILSLPLPQNPTSVDILFSQASQLSPCVSLVLPDPRLSSQTERSCDWCICWFYGTEAHRSGWERSSAIASSPSVNLARGFSWETPNEAELFSQTEKAGLLRASTVSQSLTKPGGSIPKFLRLKTKFYPDWNQSPSTSAALPEATSLSCNGSGGGGGESQFLSPRQGGCPSPRWVLMKRVPFWAPSLSSRLIGLFCCYRLKSLIFGLKQWLC